MISIGIRHCPRLLCTTVALTVLWLATFGGTAAGAQESQQHEHRSAYADDEPSGIAALTAAELQELLDGEGMGLARAAELNRYPGPKHVLELADELQLDAAQIAAVEAVRAGMLQAAQQLGAGIVEAERVLDQHFAHDHIDAATVADMALEIGRMRGNLRSVHLIAHLDTRALLHPEQITRYNELRGYTDQARSTT